MSVEKNAVLNCKKACQYIQSFNHTESLIRHAWDIEGFKLQVLFTQSLESQRDLFQHIINLQSSGGLDKVISRNEQTKLSKQVESVQLITTTRTPINVKLAQHIP